jgi:hypothetical protein
MRNDEKKKRKRTKIHTLPVVGNRLKDKQAIEERKLKAESLKEFNTIELAKPTLQRESASALQSTLYRIVQIRYLYSFYLSLCIFHIIIIIINHHERSTATASRTTTRTYHGFEVGPFFRLVQGCERKYTSVGQCSQQSQTLGTSQGV